MTQPGVSYIRGARYRAWARLLHRFDLHHTRRIGPIIDDEGDGAWLIRCEWCGLSRSEPVDRFAKINRATRRHQQALSHLDRSDSDG